MMNLIDTHSHLFLEEFSCDLPQVIARARDIGVRYVFMPNIDSTTIESLLCVCETYKGYCFPMIGLHPTSVNENFEKELDVVSRELSSSNKYIGVGEIGMDLYWDKSYLREQQIVFERQINWALECDLPIVIHCREAFDYIYKIMEPYKGTSLRGVFHSFTGTIEEAVRIFEFPDFLIGINGIVTFKKATLPGVLKEVPLEKIVLETDSPYLAPVPYRGKRNESSFLRSILIKVAEIYQISPEEAGDRTSQNALKLFGMLK